MSAPAAEPAGTAGQDPAPEPPRRDYFFVFTHIPKCGGTAVDKTMAKSLGGRPMHHREGLRRPAARMEEAERDRALFASGHFRWNDPVVSMFRQVPLFVSTVRDPISRLVSYYSYQRQKAEAAGGDGPGAAFLRMDVSEFCEQSIERFATVSSMCWFFAGTPRLEDAKATILGTYTLVTSLRSIDRFSSLLVGYVTGVPHHMETRQARSSGSSRYALDPALRQRMTDAFADDIALVKWVEEQEEALFARARLRLDPIAESLVGRRPHPARVKKLLRMQRPAA